MTNNENINKSDTDMSALIFDGQLSLQQRPRPQRKENEVLIRVQLAGICNTDHEIIRGYVPGFDGVLGHEFVGTVAEADDPSLIGKKCTAEINYACGTCDYCRQGLGRHCPNRTVMGIINQYGAFAQYICVPKENLVLIPDGIPNTNAVFIEPLAAALEILDQVEVKPDSKVLVFGDGKLGLMIGHALAATECHLTIVGKHPEKLALLEYDHIEKVLLPDFKDSQYDIVIEATGNADAFGKSVANVRPRGTIVLKSTYAADLTFNPAPIVVNEVTVVGSRCGLFSRSIDFLSKHSVSFEKLVSHRFPFHQALDAFNASESGDAVKVILEM